MGGASPAVWEPSPSFCKVLASSFPEGFRPCDSWNFFMASTVAESHLPLGAPLNEPSLPRAVWISEIRSAVGSFWPRTRRIDPLDVFPCRILVPRLTAGDFEDFVVCAAATAPATLISAATSSVRARSIAFRFRIGLRLKRREGDACVSPKLIAASSPSLEPRRRDTRSRCGRCPGGARLWKRRYRPVSAS